MTTFCEVGVKAEATKKAPKGLFSLTSEPKFTQLLLPQQSEQQRHPCP